MRLHQLLQLAASAAGVAASATPAAPAPCTGAAKTVALANGVAMPCVSLGTGDRANQTAADLEAALKVRRRSSGNSPPPPTRAPPTATIYCGLPRALAHRARRACRESGGAAWQAGFRAVDTALTYFDQAGVAEGIAAAAAKYPRADIFVTTKV